MKPAEYPHQELTREIIAAAFEVHQKLGRGFLEKVYENAMVIELTIRGCRVVQQTPIEVRYKNEIAGTYFADHLVDDLVVCELKAADAISPAHQAQLLNYLKATGTRWGCC